ncbi:hypothetical protein SK128_013366 [Halocaridina rubra]|uniref:Glycosyl hydrolases family 39 N-terminal catalytic domain-containing protein n=1 Tax=Halocaridina rubra TaxID=373956 RepID=A0AAN8X016_HALRR
MITWKDYLSVILLFTNNYCDTRRSKISYNDKLYSNGGHEVGRNTIIINNPSYTLNYIPYEVQFGKRIFRDYPNEVYAYDNLPKMPSNNRIVNKNTKNVPLKTLDSQQVLKKLYQDRTENVNYFSHGQRPRFESSKHENNNGNMRSVQQQRQDFEKVTEVEVKISGHILGNFQHIWRSTGLCPPDPHSEADKFLASQDEVMNLAMIGSLANNGIAQVRIHWLLDLVNVKLEHAEIIYNFAHLDQLMDVLRQFDLKPGFEIMGNPANIFTNFENATQVQWWRELVAEIAQRYVDKYGLEWVSSWNWESWNEPDHHDFDSLNFTLPGKCFLYSQQSKEMHFCI